METLTPRQIEITQIFLQQPQKYLTFNQIKQLTNVNSNNAIFTLLKKLVKNNILEIQKTGNVLSYRMNFSFESITCFSYIAQTLALSQNHIPIDNIRKLFKKLDTNYITVLVTGSFAKNKQTKNSDLDLIIICSNSENPQKLESQILTQAELMIPQVHLFIFTEKELLDMLLQDKENYGREIVRNNFIIYGGTNYLKIIEKAIKNGWNS